MGMLGGRTQLLRATMTDPADPQGREPFNRRSGRPRRAGDPAQADARASSPGGNTLPVVAGPVRTRERTAATDPAAKAAAAFAAHVMGQTGQKRGLRGGPQVLDHARSTYLGAEWSGHADRRPAKGVITKTEI